MLAAGPILRIRSGGPDLKTGAGAHGAYAILKLRLAKRKLLPPNRYTDGGQVRQKGKHGGQVRSVPLAQPETLGRKAEKMKHGRSGLSA
jgi:hypothetical protein